MTEVVPSAGLRLPVAAELPLAKNELYRPRLFDVAGTRLFFDSYDPLTARDSNERMDVYEWQAADSPAGCRALGAEEFAASADGCLSLISGGGSGEVGSEFAVRSGSGSDVFFSTDEGLVAGDHGEIDIYDAREGGGFPAGVVPTECEGKLMRGSGTYRRREFIHEWNCPTGKQTGPGSLQEGDATSVVSRKVAVREGQAKEGAPQTSPRQTGEAWSKRRRLETRARTSSRLA